VPQAPCKSGVNENKASNHHSTKLQTITAHVETHAPRGCMAHHNLPASACQRSGRSLLQSVTTWWFRTGFRTGFRVNSRLGSGQGLEFIRTFQPLQACNQFQRNSVPATPAYALSIVRCSIHGRTGTRLLSNPLPQKTSKIEPQNPKRSQIRALPATPAYALSIVMCRAWSCRCSENSVEVRKGDCQLQQGCCHSSLPATGRPSTALEQSAALRNPKTHRSWRTIGQGSPTDRLASPQSTPSNALHKKANQVEHSLHFLNLNPCTLKQGDSRDTSRCWGVGWGRCTPLPRLQVVLKGVAVVAVVWQL
jgi:hypothetical protein